MKTLPRNSRLFSIDIDYVCTKNADGLAQYFGLTDRVAGLPANFWFLPFANGLFDCVCTHYGLDESRELPQILHEASRVLKLGGRFVVTARLNPYDRQERYMRLFGITAAECNPLLKKARLYSGPEDLIVTAQSYHLNLATKPYICPKRPTTELYAFSPKILQQQFNNRMPNKKAATALYIRCGFC